MIRVERVTADGSACTVITLNRPKRRNALTPSMIAELVAALHTAAEAGGGVLLRGEGPVFCAGFDLRLCLDSTDGSAIRLLLSGLSDACRAMRAHPGPVVVAAQGAAIAGGCALVAAADWAIGEAGGRYGYPVTRLGISPAVNAPFLEAAVDGGRARDLSLLPDLVSGEHAARIGLLHTLCAEGADVTQAASEEAARLGGKPAEAFAVTKAWLTELEGADRDTRTDRALEVSLSLTGGQEERTMLAAALNGDR
ncbi:MAG: enoyl-CoA hydratase/isomerase family protein [Planctomycetota bacterium]